MSMPRPPGVAAVSDMTLVASGLTGLTGVGLGALCQAFVGNRRIDKVDGITAIGDAYRGTIAEMRETARETEKRNSHRMDSFERQVEDLRKEIIRKDAMLERLIEKIATVAPLTPSSSESESVVPEVAV